MLAFFFSSLGGGGGGGGGGVGGYTGFDHTKAVKEHILVGLYYKLIKLVHV